MKDYTCPCGFTSWFFDDVAKLEGVVCTHCGHVVHVNAALRWLIRMQQGEDRRGQRASMRFDARHFGADAEGIFRYWSHVDTDKEEPRQ